jgi:hypothetical protein
MVYCTLQDKPKVQVMIQTYKQVVGPLGIGFGPDPGIVIVKGSGKFPGPFDWRDAVRNTAKPGQVRFLKRFSSERNPPSAGIFC